MQLNEGASSEARAEARIEAITADATQKLWFDGQLIDHGSLQATLSTHAMHYGSGVFEGIRAYATRDGAAVFRLPEHLERMRKGAALLGLDFDPAQATRAVLATLRANGHRDAYIRPLAWFGEGSFGLEPPTGRASASTAIRRLRRR